MDLPVRLPRWKRFEDLVLGIALLLAVTPILAVVALATLLDDGPPVFYRDARVGVGGRAFNMYKFRTMVRDASSQGLGMLVASGDTRITRVGAVLRRWSLDELPQLFNVIIGDMSIVGPRPTYPAQVARYSANHRGRLRVRPGITGLAQVSGRNALSWLERIALDLDYIERLSPGLDATILLRTPGAILQRGGLYGPNGVTPDYPEKSD